MTNEKETTMISLDKLRKRSGLVIAAIGFALLAFLLGDLMNSGTSILNGAQGILGEINEEVLTIENLKLKPKT